MPETPDLNIVLKKNRLTAGLKKSRLSITPQPEKLISFVEGEIIYRRDEPFDGIYLIVEGSVRVKMVSGTGKKVQQRIANEFVGEYDSENKEARSDSAVAEKFTLLYKLDRNDLRVLFGQHPELKVNLFYFRSGAAGESADNSPASTKSPEAESTQAIIDNLFRKGPEIKRQTEDQFSSLSGTPAEKKPEPSTGKPEEPEKPKEDIPPAEREAPGDTLPEAASAEEPEEKSGGDNSMADFEALLQRAENSLGRFSKKSEDAAKAAEEETTGETDEEDTTGLPEEPAVSDKQQETAADTDNLEDVFPFSFDEPAEETPEEEPPEVVYLPDTDDAGKDKFTGADAAEENPEARTVEAPEPDEEKPTEEFSADELFEEEQSETEDAPSTESEPADEPGEAPEGDVQEKDEDSWVSFMSSLEDEEEPTAIEPEEESPQEITDTPDEPDGVTDDTALPVDEPEEEQAGETASAVADAEDDLLPIDQFDDEVDLDEPPAGEPSASREVCSEPAPEPEPETGELIEEAVGETEEPWETPEEPEQKTEKEYNYYSDAFDDVPDILPIDLIDNELDEKEEELKSIESKQEFVEQNLEDMLPIDEMFIDEEKTAAEELEQQIEDRKQTTDRPDTSLEDELEEITRDPKDDKDIVVSYIDEPPAEEQQAVTGDEAWSDFMSSIDNESEPLAEDDADEDDKIDEVSRLLEDDDKAKKEESASVPEEETPATAAEEQDDHLPIDDLDEAEEIDQEPVIEELDEAPLTDDEDPENTTAAAANEEPAGDEDEPQAKQQEPEDLVEAFSHQFPAEALLQESIDKSRSFSPDKLALLLRSANSLLTSMVKGDTVKEILKTTLALFPAEAAVFYHRENVSTLQCSILKNGSVEKYSIPLISDILSSVFENNHSIGIEAPGAHSLFDREKDSLPDIDLALTYYFPVAQEEADRVDGVLQIVNPAEPETAREHLPVIRAYTLLAAKAIAHSEGVAKGDAEGKAPTKFVLAAAGRLQDVRQAIIAKAARTANYEGEASLKTILEKQNTFDELIRHFETTLLTESGHPALIPAQPGAQLEKLLIDFAEYSTTKNIKLLKKIDCQCSASYEPAALSCAVLLSLLFLADDLEGEGKLFVSAKPEDDHCKIIIKNTSAGLAAADVEELRGTRIDAPVRSNFHFLYIAARHFVERINGECLLGAKPNDGSWIIIKLSGGEQ